MPTPQATPPAGRNGIPAWGTTTTAPTAANARAAVIAACSFGHEPLPCKSMTVGTVAGLSRGAETLRSGEQSPIPQSHNVPEVTLLVRILASLMKS